MRNIFLFLGFLIGILLVLIAFFAPLISPVLSEDSARKGLGIFGGFICVGAVVVWTDPRSWDK